MKPLQKVTLLKQNQVYEKIVQLKNADFRGTIAGNARKQIEEKSERKAITKENFQTLSRKKIS